jgi:hypothetical protein
MATVTGVEQDVEAYTHARHSLFVYPMKAFLAIGPIEQRMAVLETILVRIVP